MDLGAIRKEARKPGVKIFAICKITNDDAICVQVSKKDFLAQIKQFDDDTDTSFVFGKDRTIVI